MWSCCRLTSKKGYGPATGNRHGRGDSSQAFCLIISGPLSFLISVGIYHIDRFRIWWARAVRSLCLSLCHLHARRLMIVEFPSHFRAGILGFCLGGIFLGIYQVVLTLLCLTKVEYQLSQGRAIVVVLVAAILAVIGSWRHAVWPLLFSLFIFNRRPAVRKHDHH